MTELIDDSNIAGTVITSRTFQEGFRIQEGESSYAILAGLMEIHQHEIDAFAQFCGSVAGYAAMNAKRNNTYNNPKSGKAKNSVNKNIYQDPLQTKIRHAEEQTVGMAAEMATEWLFKVGANRIYKYAAQKANYQALEQVYSFLNNYALVDQDITNQSRVQLELAKIRNGLPLTQDERNKIYKTSKAAKVVRLEDFQSMSALNNNSQLCEALAYHIFDLYCLKYGDDEGRLAEAIEERNYNHRGMHTLLSYYDYLGFTGSHARELIRENAKRYDQISRDQKLYLQLGRMIIRNFGLEIPGIDKERIEMHCANMIKYDPYQIRRRKVQNVGIGVAESLGGLLLKKPDMVINGGALALSQLQLEDDDVKSIMEKEFKKNGISMDNYTIMLNQAKEIADKAEQ